MQFKNQVLITALAIFSLNCYADIPVMDMSAIAKLAEQISTAQSQLTTMQANLAAFGAGTLSWADLNSTSSLIANTMNSAKALSYASSNIASQFQQQYPGYKPNANYQQSYTDISSNTLNTIKGSLQAMNMSYSQFQSDSLRLKSMQAQAADGSLGAVKALQVNAQIAGETANQIAQLRSVAMAQGSAQSAYIAQQAQVEAAKKANGEALFTNGTKTPLPYGANSLNGS
jgi:P-type conjugative transfer protein TrbJ